MKTDRLKLTLHRVPGTLFVVILFLIAETARPQISTDNPAGTRPLAGETEEVSVPTAAEYWIGSPVLGGETTVRKVLRLGTIPGFQELKRLANEARSKRLKSARSLVGPGSTFLAPTAGIAFDGPSESDTNLIPPDPVIAAGPNHLVVSINSLIAIYSKLGVQQGSFQQLNSFFSSLGLAGEIYDPRVLYDQTNNRFIISAAEVDLTNFTNGHVLLAVSQTSDPTGVWYKFAIDFKGRNLSNTANTFPDFPTLGLSSSAVYLSAAQFILNAACLASNYCSFSDTWIKVISLSQLLSGSSTLTITTFKNVRDASGEPAFTVQPAITYGSSTLEFMAAASFARNPGTKLTLFAVNTSGTPTLSSIDLSAPEFWFPPDADQPGSPLGIATNDFRLLNAVWSNGSLWCAHNVGDETGSRVGARWYEISVSNLASAALLQSGTVEASGDAYYPAITAKPNGEVSVVFTTSSSAQYASAAFTGRGASDLSGTMRTPVIYRAGSAAYEDFGFRWGDYSGISLDPDGNSVWMIAEYARSPNPHFGTAVAQAGAPPALEASDTRLDFGNQPVTVTSPPQTVTISNVSGGPLTLGTASLTGVDANDFAISADSCSDVSVPPGGSCAIEVTFTPANTGLRSGTLVIDSNPAAFPLTVFLAGNGIPLPPSLVVSPTSISFPDTVVRTSSAPRTVTVFNYGSVPFTVSIYNPTYPFAIVDNCRAPVPPGGNCTLDVTFRPVSAGATSGVWFQIFAQGVTAGVLVNVAGTGITAPATTLCPTAVAFGDQVVGSTSNPQTVTLNNTGSADLTISQISVSGDFAQTNTCGPAGTILPVGLACTLNLTFAPTSIGSRTGSVTITDNATGSPHVIALTGNGVAPVVTPLKLASPPANLLPDRTRFQVPHVMTSTGTGRSERARQAFGELPLSFEMNQGQADPQVKFLSRGRGYTLFLTEDEAVFALGKPSADGATFRRSQRESAITTQLPTPVNHVPLVNDAFPPPLIQSPELSIRNHQTFIAEPPARSVLRMKIVDANPKAKIVADGELPGRSNHLIGNDPSKWRTNVPNFGKVRYEEIYPGIDLVYYGNQHKLEFDFVVAPGADPQVIAFDVEGPDQIEIDSHGGLVLGFDGREMRVAKPVVYQLRPAIPGQPIALGADEQLSNRGDRQFIDGRFVLRATHDEIRNPKGIAGSPAGSQSASHGSSYEVAFEVGPYERTLPLVIDPVLTYSTYLGGSEFDFALGIAVDTAGEAYIVGATSSEDFPTANALQPSINRTLGYVGDAFITKLSADGTSFLFSTFLGGSNNEVAYGIALDSAGNAYITGETKSTDFPVTPGAFQTSFSTGDDPYPTHAFVTKLSANGSALVYSTLLGGSAEESARGIAVDSSGNAYVAGSTSSLDFPVTAGVAQSALPSYNGQICALWTGFCGSGFVAALNPQGTGLVYGTYLGGTNSTSPQGIAVDGAGNAYVVGFTNSLDFLTTPGAFQTGQATNEKSGFLAKVSNQGRLIYSTYLGGVRNPEFTGGAGDQARAVAVDSSGSAYVAGLTNSIDFPTTPGSFQTTPFGTSGAAFVTKFHPAGCGLVYSTLLGGYYGAYANAIAVNSQGDALVAGGTASFDFPTVNPVQASCTTFYGGGQTIGCPFVTKFHPTGSSLIYSTFLGGSNSELNYCCNQANAIAIDALGNAYVAGQTRSNDFPTVNPVVPSYHGGTDGFVAGISPTLIPSLAINPTKYTFPDQATGTTSAPVTIVITNDTAGAVNISGISSGSLEFVISGNNCPGSLAPGTNCSFQVSFSPAPDTGAGTHLAIVTINDNAFAGPHIVSLFGNAYITAGLQIYSLNLDGSTMDFGSAPVGSAFDTVEVLLLNTGSVPLIFTSITATGDFTISSNGCGTQLPYYLSSCRFNLTFNPAALGMRTGVLTFIDNAPDSPQVYSLIGTGESGPNFSLSSDPDAVAVTAGQQVSSIIRVAPTGGFTGTVSLSCTGTPPKAVCSLDPRSVSLDGTNASTVQISVSTTARSAGLQGPRAWLSLLPETVPPSRSVLIFILAILIGFLICPRRRLVLTLVFFSALFWATCGGGGGSGGSTGGTPAGTYTLTVTGTAGSLSHSVRITLTVK
ncbi:MAG: choice-of-anchor D domain-containing protein [Terriglobia bacterium]